MTRGKHPKNDEPEKYTVHLALSPSLGKIVAETARTEDRSVSSLVRFLIQEALKARGVKL